jgi:hypothetical protein
MIAQAETIADTAFTVEAVGSASPTQIGVAGVFEHEVRIKPTRPAAMREAAEAAGFEDRVCWDGMPDRWLGDVDEAELISMAGWSTFRLGTLIEESAQ